MLKSQFAKHNYSLQMNLCVCVRKHPSAVMLMYYRETSVCIINSLRFVAHILPRPSLVEACTLLNGCG